MTDLGVLTATDSISAHGINGSGLVVGGSDRGFVWDSVNGIQDLNNMLDSSGTGWTLKGCRDINNAGQIVGGGISPHGSQHGYLLTPIPEPSTLALFTMSALALLAYARRRRRAS